MHSRMKRIITTVLLSALVVLSWGQKKEYQIATIAYYNLENLFDTIDTPDKRDAEYLPESEKNWDTEKYYTKLQNLSIVISKLGKELDPKGPALLGVSEIENRQVLEDLIRMPLLRPLNFGIVHYESPDKRGIDVALLYQKRRFEVMESRSARLSIPEKDDFYTRDQLVVTGNLDGEKFHVLVNHWPSRSGGEKRSRPLRNAAADLSRSLVDSIFEAEKDPNIIVLGDFNDDPINESLSIRLNAKGEKDKVESEELFNPMYELYKKGIGSLAYRDAWNLFDQIIISEGLLNDKKRNYTFFKAKIFNEEFMKQKEGRYKGYPLRTHAGGVYLAGYSDHFPAYIFLLKEPR